MEISKTSLHSAPGVLESSVNVTTSAEMGQNRMYLNKRNSFTSASQQHPPPPQALSVRQDLVDTTNDTLMKQRGGGGEMVSPAVAAAAAAMSAKLHQNGLVTLSKYVYLYL